MVGATPWHAAYLGCRDPPASFSHSPLGTTTKASPWASILAVPAQDPPLVAQSFLPASDTPPAPSAKGIEPNTLELVQRVFNAKPDVSWSVEQVVEEVGISKTTGRRYLEYCVEMGFIGVEMQYGNIGHPRRLYRKISDT